MELVFHSIDDRGSKTLFRSKYKIIDDKIIFSDKSTPGCTIEFSPNVPLNFKRSGSVLMSMSFMPRMKTKGYYKNLETGLEFDFEVYTDNLKMENNKFQIEYTMFLYNERLSSHKIWILLH